MADYPTGVTADDATTPAVTTDYRFVQIPEDVLYDQSLSPQAVRIYGVLMRHGTSPDHCYPSHERIGAFLGVSARSVQRPMAELVKSGWIAKTKRFNQRGERTSDGYHVYTQRAESRVATAQEVPLVQRAETSEEREPEINLNESNKPTVVASDDVRFVFDAWREATSHPRAVLDEKRRSKITNALKRFPVEDLVDAVRGWRWSSYHRGGNDNGTVYNDLDLLLRNAANVEKFRDWERGIDRPRDRPNSKGARSESAIDAAASRFNGQRQAEPMKLLP